MAAVIGQAIPHQPVFGLRIEIETVAMVINGVRRVVGALSNRDEPGKVLDPDRISKAAVSSDVAYPGVDCFVEEDGLIGGVFSKGERSAAHKILHTAVLHPLEATVMRDVSASINRLKGLRYRRVHRDPISFQASNEAFVIAIEVSPRNNQLVHVDGMKPGSDAGMMHQNGIANKETVGRINLERTGARGNQRLYHHRHRAAVRNTVSRSFHRDKSVRVG